MPPEAQDPRGMDAVTKAETSSSSNADARADTATVEPGEKKQGSPMAKIKGAWQKLGLDKKTVMMMAKGALAPTIALAAYQSDAFSAEYTTLGYLVCIVTILSVPIMPRAKFVQNMLYLVLATCFATALALLAIYCCVQARGGSTATYSSSASAVAGIWLFVEVWLINTIKARNPALTVPSVVVAIFANVSMVYAPEFTTMASGIAFARKLLVSFLTGMGISTGVSLFVFPVNMRQVVSAEMAGYVGLLRKLMGANMAYIASLEEVNMFNRTPTGIATAPRPPTVQAIRGTLAALTALHGKLTVDLKLAKKEIAIGKLGPDDLQEVFRRLRSLLHPVVGLSSLADVFERVTEERGWDAFTEDRPLDEIDNQAERERATSIQDWHDLAGILKTPFSNIVKDVDAGLAHVSLTLELAPRPKTKQADEEAKGDGPPAPGSSGFTPFLDSKVGSFHGRKSELLEKYAVLRNIKLPPDFFEGPRTAHFEAAEWMKETPDLTELRGKNRRQLYLVLYMDFLIDSVAHKVLDFCRYADEKAQTKMKKKRLIVPGLKRFRKLVIGSFTRKQDHYTDETHGMNENSGSGTSVYLGDAYNRRRNPEHLTPTTAWERFGDRLRAIPHFLRSPAAAFGLRAALATMSIAVVAFLRNTQDFYVVQRLFWAQIMVSISMSPSAGQSMFSFAARVVGTFLAMCTSLLVWYIPDGHTAGVIVLFGFAVSWGFYIILKHPRFVPVGMIFSVTTTLVVGYGLQVQKIGITVSESNGQAYYPTYELAPYRLATVCAGIFLAWIWTMFPYPISEHSELRRDLGASLYLLANYYSVVDETIRVRISGELLTSTIDSPVAQLDKQRQKVFSKSLLLIQALRAHSGLVKLDIPVGGKFPKQTYDRIIHRIQSLLNFTSLTSFASETFAEMQRDRGSSPTRDPESESAWLRDFRRLSREANVTSREVTTLLSLLSASVSAGQPLPPYVRAPEPYALSTKLDALDADILSVRHLTEPGYSAFCCVQIATKAVTDDLRALLRDVRELVGELDFSFHVVSTAGSSGSSGRSSGEDGGSGKGKAD